jgi:predicted nucleotidyltransferase
MVDIQVLIDFFRANGIRRAALFGSVSRGEEKPDSDLDLLVDFDSPKSLMTVVRLERELSQAVGRKVELLTEASISPLIRERIAADLKVIHAA